MERVDLEVQNRYPAAHMPPECFRIETRVCADRVTTSGCHVILEEITFTESACEMNQRRRFSHHALDLSARLQTLAERRRFFMGTGDTPRINRVIGCQRIDPEDPAPSTFISASTCIAAEPSGPTDR